MSKWFSVTEKLPPFRYDIVGNLISDYVIIWCEKDSEGGSYEWYDIGFFNPKTETFDNQDEQGYFITICDIRYVKAWMPLPNPPKKREGGE